MELKHLTDSELQALAGSANTERANASHVDSCVACQNKLKFYQSLFAAMTEMQEEYADFDITQTVIQSIEVKGRVKFPVQLLKIGGLAIGLMLILTTIIIALRWNLFSASDPIVFVMIVLGAASFVVYESLHKLKKHHRQLNRIQAN